MNEPWEHYTKCNVGHKGQILWLHLHEVPSVVKSIDTSSRMVVAKDFGLGRMGWLYDGDRLSV